MRQPNYIRIADKKYPMVFSLYGAQKLILKYGSMESAVKKMKKNNNQAERMSIIADYAECLIQNGCEYCNEFGLIDYHDAPIEEGKLVPISARKILLLCGLKNLQVLVDAIEITLNGDQKKKINTKPDRNAKKKKAR